LSAVAEIVKFNHANAMLEIPCFPEKFEVLTARPDSGPGNAVKSPQQAIAKVSITTSQRDPVNIRRFRRAELPAGTVALARFLIGKVIVRELPTGRLAGRIVETEAYPPRDPAAHHFRGPTPRTRSMFLRRGHAYVYFSYGNHFMLNVTSELPGVGGGVLIRALEPLEGIEQMHLHRGTSRVLDLTRGPGRLASALQIDRRLDGVDLCAPGPLWIGALTPVSVPDAAKTAQKSQLGISKRIGITRAPHRLLRFYERGNPFVSGPSRLRS
jgi:DNA-3-methyladenine glycosylase